MILSVVKKVLFRPTN